MLCWVACTCAFVRVQPLWKCIEQKWTRPPNDLCCAVFGISSPNPHTIPAFWASQASGACIPPAIPSRGPSSKTDPHSSGHKHSSFSRYTCHCVGPSASVTSCVQGKKALLNETRVSLLHRPFSDGGRLDGSGNSQVGRTGPTCLPPSGWSSSIFDPTSWFSKVYCLYRWRFKSAWCSG